MQNTPQTHAVLQYRDVLRYYGFLNYTEAYYIKRSVTMDTACSSSMYALHMALASIRSGDCDSAIVAGSNLILGPEVQILTTKLGAASPTSVCHTFDVSADGYARAEGVGALYLKKIPDALSHGNPLRAILRGTSINS